MGKGWVVGDGSLGLSWRCEGKEVQKSNQGGTKRAEGRGGGPQRLVWSRPRGGAAKLRKKDCFENRLASGATPPNDFDAVKHEG